MPYDVNIGIDHPFNNARRQHVQMLERTDRLAHRPEVFAMVGGGPLREYAFAGKMVLILWMSRVLRNISVWADVFRSVGRCGR